VIDNDKALREAATLLALLAQSEAELQIGRWLSQEEIEKELRERLNI
jgi:hypothetical protein